MKKIISIILILAFTSQQIAQDGFYLCPTPYALRPQSALRPSAVSIPTSRDDGFNKLKADLANSEFIASPEYLKWALRQVERVLSQKALLDAVLQEAKQLREKLQIQSRLLRAYKYNEQKDERLKEAISGCKSFSERLKALMNKTGMDIDTLAKKVEVGHTTVDDWRAGRNIPNEPNIFEIAQVLKVNFFLLRDGKFSTIDDRVKKSRSFGKRLENLCAFFGITAAELAEETGVSVAAIHLIKKGGVGLPRPDTVSKIAQFFKMSQAVFICGEDISIFEFAKRQKGLWKMLRAVRIYSLFSVDDLAEASGLNSEYIRRLENGMGGQVRFDTIDKFCKPFKLDEETQKLIFKCWDKLYGKEAIRIRLKRAYKYNKQKDKKLETAVSECKTLGERITILMQLRGIDAKGLQKILGVASKETVLLWMKIKDESEISEVYLFELAQALSVNFFLLKEGKAMTLEEKLFGLKDPYFGMRLRIIREFFGLTQEDLAYDEKVRLSPGYISNIEKGVRKMPRFPVIKRLAAFFKINHTLLTIGRDLTLKQAILLEEKPWERLQRVIDFKLVNIYKLAAKMKINPGHLLKMLSGRQPTLHYETVKSLRKHLKLDEEEFVLIFQGWVEGVMAEKELRKTLRETATVTERIKIARKQRLLSQIELAKSAKIDPSFFNHCEQNKQQFRPQDLIAIAKVLKLPVNYLASKQEMKILEKAAAVKGPRQRRDPRATLRKILKAMKELNTQLIKGEIDKATQAMVAEKTRISVNTIGDYIASNKKIRREWELITAQNILAAARRLKRQIKKGKPARINLAVIAKEAGVSGPVLRKYIDKNKKIKKAVDSIIVKTILAATGYIKVELEAGKLQKTDFETIAKTAGIAYVTLRRYIRKYKKIENAVNKLIALNILKAIETLEAALGAQKAKRINLEAIAKKIGISFVHLKYLMSSSRNIRNAVMNIIAENIFAVCQALQQKLEQSKIKKINITRVARGAGISVQALRYYIRLNPKIKKAVESCIEKAAACSKKVMAEKILSAIETLKEQLASGEIKKIELAAIARLSGCTTVILNRYIRANGKIRKAIRALDEIIYKRILDITEALKQKARLGQIKKINRKMIAAQAGYTSKFVKKYIAKYPKLRKAYKEAISNYFIVECAIARLKEKYAAGQIRKIQNRDIAREIGIIEAYLSVWKRDKKIARLIKEAVAVSDEEIKDKILKAIWQLNEQYTKTQIDRIAVEDIVRQAKIKRGQIDHYRRKYPELAQTVKEALRDRYLTRIKRALPVVEAMYSDGKIDKITLTIIARTAKVPTALVEKWMSKDQSLRWRIEPLLATQSHWEVLTTQKRRAEIMSAIESIRQKAKAAKITDPWSFSPKLLASGLNISTSTLKTRLKPYQGLKKEIEALKTEMESIRQDKIRQAKEKILQAIERLRLKLEKDEIDEITQAMIAKEADLSDKAHEAENCLLYHKRRDRSLAKAIDEVLICRSDALIYRALRKLRKEHGRWAELTHEMIAQATGLDIKLVRSRLNDSLFLQRKIKEEEYKIAGVKKKAVLLPEKDYEAEAKAALIRLKRKLQEKQIRGISKVAIVLEARISHRSLKRVLERNQALKAEIEQLIKENPVPKFTRAEEENTKADEAILNTIKSLKERLDREEIYCIDFSIVVKESGCYRGLIRKRAKANPKVKEALDSIAPYRYESDIFILRAVARLKADLAAEKIDHISQVMIAGKAKELAKEKGAGFRASGYSIISERKSKNAFLKKAVDEALIIRGEVVILRAVESLKKDLIEGRIDEIDRGDIMQRAGFLTFGTTARWCRKSERVRKVVESCEIMRTDCKILRAIAELNKDFKEGRIKKIRKSDIIRRATVGQRTVYTRKDENPIIARAISEVQAVLPVEGRHIAKFEIRRILEGAGWQAEIALPILQEFARGNDIVEVLGKLDFLSEYRKEMEHLAALKKDDTPRHIIEYFIFPLFPSEKQRQAMFNEAWARVKLLTDVFNMLTSKIADEEKEKIRQHEKQTFDYLSSLDKEMAILLSIKLMQKLIPGDWSKTETVAQNWAVITALCMLPQVSRRVKDNIAKNFLTYRPPSRIMNILFWDKVFGCIMQFHNVHPMVVKQAENYIFIGDSLQQIEQQARPQLPGKKTGKTKKIKKPKPQVKRTPIQERLEKLTEKMKQIAKFPGVWLATASEAISLVLGNEALFEDMEETVELLRDEFGLALGIRQQAARDKKHKRPITEAERQKIKQVQEKLEALAGQFIVEKEPEQLSEETEAEEETEKGIDIYPKGLDEDRHSRRFPKEEKLHLRGPKPFKINLVTGMPEAWHKTKRVDNSRQEEAPEIARLDISHMRERNTGMLQDVFEEMKAEYEILDGVALEQIKPSRVGNVLKIFQDSRRPIREKELKAALLAVETANEKYGLARILGILLHKGLIKKTGMATYALAEERDEILLEDEDIEKEICILDIEEAMAYFNMKKKMKHRDPQRYKGRGPERIINGNLAEIEAGLQKPQPDLPNLVMFFSAALANIEEIKNAEFKKNVLSRIAAILKKKNGLRLMHAFLQETLDMIKPIGSTEAEIRFDYIDREKAFDNFVTVLVILGPDNKGIVKNLIMSFQKIKKAPRYEIYNKKAEYLLAMLVILKTLYASRIGKVFKMAEIRNAVRTHVPDIPDECIQQALATLQAGRQAIKVSRNLHVSIRNVSRIKHRMFSKMSPPGRTVVRAGTNLSLAFGEAA